MGVVHTAGSFQKCGIKEALVSSHTDRSDGVCQASDAARHHERDDANCYPCKSYGLLGFEGQGLP